MNHQPLTIEALRRKGFAIPSVRFRTEIDAFVRADAERPPEPGGVLFVGDSDIARWRAEDMFDEHFRGLGAVNRGFGGARSWETLLYFRETVESSRPRTIVYNAGDNDLIAGADIPLGQIRDCFALFLDAVASRLPETRRVMYLAIHPAPARAGGEAAQQEANRLLRQLCEEDPRAEFVDYLGLLRDETGALREECFVPDGLHYSAAFYAEWAAFLRPRLEPGAGGRRTDQRQR
jgi:lysophospholipase L1-like esterase